MFTSNKIQSFLLSVFTLALFIHNTPSFAQKKIASLVTDNKAYKEAKAIKTLNVNIILNRQYEDGLALTFRQWAVLSSGGKKAKKFILTKVPTGRKDIDGEEVTAIKLKHAPTGAVFHLIPRYHFFATDYRSFRFAPDREKMHGYKDGASRYNMPQGYRIRDNKRLSIYGDGNDGFTTKTKDTELSIKLEEKLKYDRSDLFETKKKKQFQGYKKYLEDYQKNAKHFEYLSYLDECLKDEFIYKQTDKNRNAFMKVKITKIYDNNNKLEKIVFGLPFKDGSYPEKPEFQKIATRNSKTGFFRVNLDDREQDLIPFDGTIYLAQFDYKKNLLSSYNISLFTNFYDMFLIRDLEEYSGSKDYEEEWTLDQTTNTYDYKKDNLKFTSFMQNIVVPKLKASANK